MLIKFTVNYPVVYVALAYYIGTSGLVIIHRIRLETLDLILTDLLYLESVK